MKMLLFARRNGQEILRDPLNLAFGLVFPGCWGSSAPFRPIYRSPYLPFPALTPGVLVFGFSFFSLFPPFWWPGTGPAPFSCGYIQRLCGPGLHLRLHPPPGAPGPGTRSRMSGRRFGLWTGMEPPASPDVGGQPACSPIVHQPGTALRLLPQRPGCGWGLARSSPMPPRSCPAHGWTWTW